MEYLSENLLAPISGWEVWSPRENIAIKRESTSQGEVIYTTKEGDLGKLKTWAELEENQYYEYKVTCVLENIQHPRMSTRFVVDTYTADGGMVQTAYAPHYEEKDGVYTVWGRFQALSGTAKAEVAVMLMMCENGKVTVKSASLRKTDPIPERKVKVATAYVNPYLPDEKTFEKRFAKVLKSCDTAGLLGSDILVLSEGIPSRELPREDPNQFAEPIPGNGPICSAIAEKAAKYGMWILVNTREVDLETGLFYNTTAIYNRKGEFHGKYRKCNITYAEYDAGLTPGRDYPVFDTDFGRIGTVTCFDQFFPESIRSLVLQGAEIVFTTTAGDPYHQITSRALENSVYVVVAGVNHAKASDQPISRIISPQGEILAGTNEDMGVAVATIDLNKPNYAFWFSVGGRYGDKRDINILERRPSTYGKLVE